jgi:hypothetical protein
MGSIKKIFKGSRTVVMSVFFRPNLHTHFRLILQAPSPVLSRVIRLEKGLSNSLCLRTIRLVGCGIRSSVWQKHNWCNYKTIIIHSHTQLLIGSLTGQLLIPRYLNTGNRVELREEQIFINPSGYFTGSSQNFTWFLTPSSHWPCFWPPPTWWKILFTHWGKKETAFDTARKMTN